MLPCSLISVGNFFTNPAVLLPLLSLFQPNKLKTSRFTCMLVFPVLVCLPSAKPSSVCTTLSCGRKHPRQNYKWTRHGWDVFTEHRVLSEGLSPTRSAFLHLLPLWPSPQLPLPSLFIASHPLIFLHRFFSVLLSCSPPLFAEVMTEPPWHMLRGWTSTASKHTPATHAEPQREHMLNGLLQGYHTNKGQWDGDGK